MNHIAIAVPGGFAVAYHRPTGGLFAVSEHATRGSAQLEADNLNAAHAARIAAARTSAARHRQHAFAERRPVRWFEPDAFA